VSSRASSLPAGAASQLAGFGEAAGSAFRAARLAAVEVVVLTMDDDRGFFETLITGRSLLILTALTLMGCGAFALFQAATGQFLPHDVDFLGLTARQLCTLRGCRVVHFMMHDRVSFGGVLLAIGVMYLWLTEFPLRR